MDSERLHCNEELNSLEDKRVKRADTRELEKEVKKRARLQKGKGRNETWYDKELYPEMPKLELMYRSN